MGNQLGYYFLFAMIVVVGSAFCPPAARAKDAAAGASDQTVFEIPQLQGISVDGDSSTWGDRGFQISVMHSGSLRRSGDSLDAQIRLGWDERGLLVLADVTDPTLRDEDFAAAPGNGPSVVVFVADAVGGKEHWQASIQPGVDPKKPGFSTLKFDSKAQINRIVQVPVTAVTRKTDGGYAVEALLPWNVLGVKAEAGREIGVQVYVNDGNGSQLLWYPRGGADSNSSMMQRVRLARDASPTVTVAADGGYEHLRRARISIAGTADWLGKKAEVKAGEDVLGETTLKADGRLAMGHVTLAMPAFGEQYGSLGVWVDGRQVDEVSLPDADGLRKDAIRDLKFDVDTVFNSTYFPSIDFGSPGDAEDSLGQYEIQTTFYDRDYHEVTRAEQPGRYGAVVEVTSQHAKPMKRYITLYRTPLDLNWRYLNLKAALALPAKLGIDEAVVREQVLADGDFLGGELREDRYRDDEEAVLLCGLSEISPGVGDLPRRLGPEGKNIAWWYGLKKQIGDLTPYRYLVHVPEEKQGASAGKFPLILFLHGSGERGDDLSVVAVHGPPKILKAEPDWEFKDQFIVVSPQCQNGERWNPLQLRDLLDEVMAKYPVDPDHVYVTGLSMGGFGSWELAEWFPERFAAAVPICGAGDPFDAQRIVDIPTWVFHGGRDGSVPIEDAYEMVQRLRDLHGRVRFTVYPEYGHNSWEPAYDDADVYAWMLAQKRGQPAQSQSTLPDTRPDVQ
jgi:pimeloyl-ACP methyl ester carboxylesterase